METSSEYDDVLLFAEMVRNLDENNITGTHEATLTKQSSESQESASPNFNNSALPSPEALRTRQFQINHEPKSDAKSDAKSKKRNQQNKPDQAIYQWGDEISWNGSIDNPPASSTAHSEKDSRNNNNKSSVVKLPVTEKRQPNSHAKRQKSNSTRELKSSSQLSSYQPSRNYESTQNISSVNDQQQQQQQQQQEQLVQQQDDEREDELLYYFLQEHLASPTPKQQQQQGSLFPSADHCPSNILSKDTLNSDRHVNASRNSSTLEMNKDSSISNSKSHERSPKDAEKDQSKRKLDLSLELEADTHQQYDLSLQYSNNTSNPLHINNHIAVVVPATEAYRIKNYGIPDINLMPFTLSAKFSLPSLESLGISKIPPIRVTDESLLQTFYARKLHDCMPTEPDAHNDAVNNSSANNLHDSKSMSIANQPLFMSTSSSSSSSKVVFSGSHSVLTSEPTLLTTASLLAPLLTDPVRTQAQLVHYSVAEYIQSVLDRVKTPRARVSGDTPSLFSNSDLTVVHTEHEKVEISQDQGETGEVCHNGGDENAVERPVELANVNEPPISTNLENSSDTKLANQGRETILVSTTATATATATATVGKPVSTKKNKPVKAVTDTKADLSLKSLLTRVVLALTDPDALVQFIAQCSGAVSLSDSELDPSAMVGVAAVDSGINAMKGEAIPPSLLHSNIAASSSGTLIEPTSNTMNVFSETGNGNEDGNDSVPLLPDLVFVTLEDFHILNCLHASSSLDDRLSRLRLEYLPLRARVESLAQCVWMPGITKQPVTPAFRRRVYFVSKALEDLSLIKQDFHHLLHWTGLRNFAVLLGNLQDKAIRNPFHAETVLRHGLDDGSMAETIASFLAQHPCVGVSESGDGLSETTSTSNSSKSSSPAGAAAEEPNKVRNDVYLMTVLEIFLVGHDDITVADLATMLVGQSEDKSVGPLKQMRRVYDACNILYGLGIIKKYKKGIMSLLRWNLCPIKDVRVFHILSKQ